MKDLRNTTEALEQWFADDPTPSPDPAIEGALREVALTNQRHRWWPLVPTTPRGRDRRVFFGAVASAVSLALILLVAGVAVPRILDGAPPEVASAPGEIIVVAPDGTGDVESISAAVERAQDGDTILLRPGTYTDSVIVTRDITISGDGARDEVVVIAGDEHPVTEATLPGWPDVAPAAYAFALVDSAATIQSLTIEGPEVARAIVVLGGEVRLTDLSVSLEGSYQGWAGDNPHGAIHFGAEARGELTDSDIASGWVQYDGGSSPVVRGNHLSCHGVVHGSGTDPIIESNTFALREDGCHYLLKVAYGAAPLIKGNDFSIVGAEAVVVTPSDFVHNGSLEGRAPWVAVSGDPVTRIIGNRIHDSGTGLSLDTDARVEVAGNTIESNRIGLTVRGNQARIEDNILRGNTVGVTVWSASPALVGNRIEANETGLHMDAAASPGLQDNSICNNGDNLKVGGTPVGATDDSGCLVMPAT